MCLKYRSCLSSVPGVGSSVFLLWQQFCKSSCPLLSVNMTPQSRQHRAYPLSDSSVSNDISGTKKRKNINGRDESLRGKKSLNKNLLRRLTQPPAEDLIKPRTATLSLGCQVRDRRQSNIKCRRLFAVIMTFPCACTNSEANDLCQALRLMRWQTVSTLWLAVGLGNG